MKKIKGYRDTKGNFIHRILLKEEDKTLETRTIKDVKHLELQEIKAEDSSCFALVVIRKIPWYKKLIRSIRNLIIIYRWRKAR